MARIPVFKKVTLTPVGTPAAAQTDVSATPWKSWIWLGLLAVIAVAPAPLGSAGPFASAIMDLAIGVLIAALLLSHSDGDSLARDMIAPAVLFGIVAVYAFIQCVPLGGAANPLWDIAADGAQLPARGTIAVAPALALAALTRLLAYAGIFLLAYLLGRDRNRARWALPLLGFSAAIYALYGLAVYWTGNTTILWFAKSAFPRDLSATFLDPNSAATYFGMAILAVLADLIATLEPLRLSGTWQQQWRRLSQFAIARAWPLGALVILATAVLLTHSRGGLAATLLGAIAFLLAIGVAPSLRPVRYVAWVAVPLGLVLAALLFSGEIGVARLALLDLPPSDDPGNLDALAATWRAVTDFVFTGTGLGSFAAVFQIYRPETAGSFAGQAPDSYLQALLELGAPAALCLFAAIAWLVGLCLRGVWRRNRDASFPALGFAATVLVASHALVGTGLDVPAVAASYMLILGVAVAQSRSAAAA